MIRATQLLLLASCCLYCLAQAQATDSLAPRLTAVPVELYLADSSLRIVNLYKLEAMAVRDPVTQWLSVLVECGLTSA